MTGQWKILEPIQLGEVVCRNRILMAAHSYGYVDSEGLPTDYLVSYVAERAKGGIGLITLGATAISKKGALTERMILNLDDRILPWYQRIADEVHKHGALVFDQLMHAGGQLEPHEGVRAEAPSAIPHEAYNHIPTELTVDQIRDIVTDFAQAALRSKLGGLDGIELKCDQGYLIHQFLSPYYNRRTDEYGGTYEKRLRFLLDVLERVREAVGDDFVVGVRITGDSMTRGDLALKDAINIARSIEGTGTVDFMHINGATNSTYQGYRIGHADSSVEPMNFAPLAREIKKAVNLPVMVASVILHPSEAEHLVRSGVADMVAMTRAHIADAEIINKVKEGRIDEIRPCILCNQGCTGNHWNYSDVRCIHNSATGRERELGIGTVNKTAKSKRVAVIGGGPAGLEFARIASMRGHVVELFEKEKLVGGQLLLASRFPYRQGMLDIVHFLEQQTRKYNVFLHPGVQVTAGDLLAAAADFDSIVIATGSELYIPPLYEGGVDPQCILTIKDALEEEHLGEHILVVDSCWRHNPLGVVEWLVQRNREVTVVTSDYIVGAGIDIVTRTSYYSRLCGRVTFLPLTVLEWWKDQTAGIRHTLTDEMRELSPVDHVVFVSGSRPNSDLYFTLKRKLDNVFRVGDCVDALGIPEAMLAANRLARVL